PANMPSTRPTPRSARLRPSWPSSRRTLMPYENNGMDWRPMTDRVRAELASRASFAAFTATGVSFSTWASRIPQVQDALALTPKALGLVLLALAAGSVVALPLAGIVVARIG